MPITARSTIPAGSSPIRITRATVFRGRTVSPGDTFPDATGAEASLLIGCSKAERWTPAAAPAPTRSVDITLSSETAAVEPRIETAALPHKPARKHRHS